MGSEREEILVDANREAEGREYYQVANWEVSPGQDLVAFLEDTRGRSQQTLRVREIATGRDLPDRIEGLSSSLAWAADNRTLFYVENDPVTLLTKRVKRHLLGSDPKCDPAVYEEEDDSFYLEVKKSGDQEFVTIALRSTVSSEAWVLAAADPAGAPRLLAPRAHDVLYHADHLAGRWVILTDWEAPNFRTMTVPDEAIGDRARWSELLPHDPAVLVEGFALFRDHLVLNERSEGLLRLRVVPWKDPARTYFVRSDEPAYRMLLDLNPEQATAKVRYRYQSMTTPESVYEVELATGERTLLEREPVLGGFDPANYRTERLWATARDGTRVPVSIAYREGFERDGRAPLLLHGYGSYGASFDPFFDLAGISLLDRGFAIAIAHVRGGQELGRAWREAGRLLRKTNTFTDFVDVTDFLVREKYAARGRVAALGVSAGGLLVGAVANLAPDRYRAIAALLPFVDVVTTMLDPSIPLTSNEFDEWGDPRVKESYDYMLSYSPYDNVRAQAYPALLVVTGLQDAQVQYFEPAKWVAKLRATKTGEAPLRFRVEMAAGHGGKSGRFEQLRETAEIYAFLARELGIEH